MAKLTRAEFIRKLAPHAISDMHITKVPASLTIAQGILESADGNSSLTVQANNLFGIKGKGTAGSVTMPTKEFSGGKWITVNAPFRKYNNWGESVADHSTLIVNGVSWDRNKYRGVLGADGRTAAREIAAAGYATDPTYADKLIRLMDDWNLYQYDIKEEDQPMTATEKKAFEELQAIVTKQAERIEELENQRDIPAPEWAQEAAKYYYPHMNPKTGSYDFWRAITIQYRKEKGITV
ncbi:MAG: glycoside hydrolase family 73 protein [Paenibacillus macerans]|uniref:glycoside hydrolase family 73 protein n=1 Tax=Paenibacillus macerans TaxID=44252 RepID=UPI001F0EAF84|nr:glycoside hydrolase family 73 protein [Paenibacillus macerans]MDU7473605.1 glycoside hydrolase family 73 protein [Paenibacillus macerans]MEC0139189.1 glycoside hydrolase family 73 protein [Paenibacillus macerans]UMV47270.1 glycoside hydrolase family 73 protein [Paenibacillus macerans]